MSTTIDNLKIAFAGESQANRKYLAFARKADKEQLPGIARLFRAAAEAETIHALGHLQNMDGIGSTLENLQAATAGETYEYSEMYPPMVEQAENENHRSKTLFRYALEAERVHAGLFTKALAALAAGTDLAAVQIYLCPVCGDIEIGQPPERCPICNALGSKFERIA
jgi:rubrerythrin